MSTMSNDKRATKPGHSTSPLSRRTLIALTALCIVSLLGHIALLPHMPEMIPTHWDAAGTVDGWTGRTAIVALDALPLLFLFMFHIIPRIDPRGQAYERMGLFYTGFVILFTIFIVAMTWSSELTVFGILPESGSLIGAATSIAVGVGLMLLGNYMPKIKSNYTFGVRTPWALNDDDNWRLTHRFCGIACVLAGIAVVGAGALSLQHGEIAFWVLMAAVLGASIVTYLYSFLVYRNGNRPLRTR